MTILSKVVISNLLKTFHAEFFQNLDPSISLLPEISGMGIQTLSFFFGKFVDGEEYISLHKDRQVGDFSADTID